MLSSQKEVTFAFWCLSFDSSQILYTKMYTGYSEKTLINQIVCSQLPDPFYLFNNRIATKSFGNGTSGVRTKVCD